MYIVLYGSQIGLTFSLNLTKKNVIGESGTDCTLIVSYFLYEFSKKSSEKHPTPMTL